MHWTDTAIVLSARKHGETSAVVRLFARQHGVFAGVVRGIQSKANRGVVQPGNIVTATWQARLSEQLGIFKIELLEANAALIMDDAGKLAALSAACTILESALPERHPYPRLYKFFQAFLTTLREDGDWPEAYVRLELDLLAESGFGLDLSSCAATGATEDLLYVSPKSGRAVSREPGEPYKDKLLALPSFLISPPPAGGRAREGVNHRKPNRHGSHILIPNARELRKQTTPEEQHLWYHLRGRRLGGHRFRRQHPLTPDYIVDFICLDQKLVIELDGGQHTDQADYDARRTILIEREGYRLLRFWNHEVLENTDGVLDTILKALTPTPALPLQGGGRRARRGGWG